MKSVSTPASYRYLIVDDDSFTCDCLVKLLTRYDALDVQTASNGRIAIQWLEKTPTVPDIIICDLSMPELDGIEYIQYLARKEFPGGVILVSGSVPQLLDSVVRLAQARHLNVLGTLTKPIVVEEITGLLLSFGNKASMAAAN